MKKDKSILIFFIINILFIPFAVKFNLYWFSGWIIFLIGMVFGLISTLIEKAINLRK